MVGLLIALGIKPSRKNMKGKHGLCIPEVPEEFAAKFSIYSTERLSYKILGNFWPYNAVERFLALWQHASLLARMTGSLSFCLSRWPQSFITGNLIIEKKIFNDY